MSRYDLVIEWLKKDGFTEESRDEFTVKYFSKKRRRLITLHSPAVDDYEISNLSQLTGFLQWHDSLFRDQEFMYAFHNACYEHDLTLERMSGHCERYTRGDGLIFVSADGILCVGEIALKTPTLRYLEDRVSFYEGK